MESNNQTAWASGFILLGLTDDTKNERILFVFFLLVYSLTLVGNSLMVITITLSSTLSSPMYLFLRYLSIVDICFTSSTVPKLLLDFLSELKTISFPGCVAQMYLFISFGGIECVLLSVMAGDRYVAICMPLRYTEIMSRKLCIKLVAVCSFIGFLNSLAHTVFTFRLPFCNSRFINLFFCDVPPLLAIACADTTPNEVVVYTAGGSVIVGSFLVTLLSYIFIVRAIINMKTASGRYKTFSTCGSHLTVVTLFFGTSVFTYIRPTSTYSLDQDKVVPVLYGIMTPLLNPIIYSLRNREVQEAIKKVIFRRSIRS
ncbi:olfactory receptor 5V1-like [Bombina bombina]|uniref:olfactory receptor 5V1-like n=1 Tax=Bombina bombina TaxID=8345 RepID=UPI00235B2455|nr:olfactory receptor 5V1-like [Bombina bombina]